MTLTFERYADRLDAYQLVKTGAIPESELMEAILGISRAVAEVDGRGFEVTPFAPNEGLATVVGLNNSAELWVKDETGNVSGSHKARHLFGVALAHHLGSESMSAPDTESPFAIASCGNAALAAAVLSCAVERPLDVYVPDWANDSVVASITELGGRVVRCERTPGVVGDPAHHAFIEAISGAAVPFSCQGTQTPTAIDGGRTLAYEMVDALIAALGGTGPASLDRIVIQVGGGALACAVVTGLARSVTLGDLTLLPVVHAVQPVGNHPLVRAWDRIVSELLGQPVPSNNRGRAAAANALGPMGDSELRAVMARIRERPECYMTAWEQPPMSYASGILDDITYDWIPIIEAMLTSTGWPVVASERHLRRAHALAHERTDINVCPTGAAGLGGLLALVDSGVNPSTSERLAVLFTGSMRPGDPAPERPARP